MIKYKYFIIILAFFFCQLFVVYGNDIYESRGFRVLDSSDRGITIQFQPQQWLQDTVTIAQKQYIRLDFFHATFDATPGEPLIPFIPVTVGIPLDSDVRYSILSADFREIPGMLLPQSGVIKKENIYINQHVGESDIYQQNSYFPNEVIETGKPEYIRDQRIVKVGISPVQFNPVTGKIRLHHSITVRIDFSRPAQQVHRSELPKSSSSFLDDLVINNEHARNWRLMRKTSLKKHHSIFDSSNPWYKIYINDDGVYKLTGSDLNNFGIDIKAIDPQTLKIYNNGGKELPRSVTATQTDSLIENAIIVEDGGDGIFDILDYILFYGKAGNNWEYNPTIERFAHYINHYQDQNIYWLTWGGEKPGKRMQQKSGAPDNSLTAEPYFIDYLYFEKENINFLN